MFKTQVPIHFKNLLHLTNFSGLILYYYTQYVFKILQ